MQRSKIFVQNRVFCLPHLHSTPPLGGFPSEYRHPIWHGKTIMIWLPGGENYSKISLFVLTQLTNVTDTQTDTPHDGIGRAYASHRAAKTVSVSTVDCLNPLTGTLKPKSNGPLCSDTVIGTLPVDAAPPSPSSLYQMQQPTHQRPVYLHIIQYGIIITFAH